MPPERVWVAHPQAAGCPWSGCGPFALLGVGAAPRSPCRLQGVGRGSAAPKGLPEPRLQPQVGIRGSLGQPGHQPLPWVVVASSGGAPGSPWPLFSFPVPSWAAWAPWAMPSGTGTAALQRVRSEARIGPRHAGAASRCFNSLALAFGPRLASIAGAVGYGQKFRCSSPAAHSGAGGTRGFRKGWKIAEAVPGAAPGFPFLAGITLWCSGVGVGSGFSQPQHPGVLPKGHGSAPKRTDLLLQPGVRAQLRGHLGMESPARV